MSQRWVINNQKWKMWKTWEIVESTLFIWYNLCFVLKVSYFINFSWCPSLTLFMFCLTISNFEPIIGYWKIGNESEKQKNCFISRQKGLKLICFLWKWLILTVWCIQNWDISNLRVKIGQICQTKSEKLAYFMWRLNDVE